MNTFFCAQESRDAGEDPIANADNYRIYLLIECPPPWIRNAFDSQPIPLELKSLQEEIESIDDSIAFLLIYNEQIKQTDATRVIIYHRDFDLAPGYSKYEFTVPDIHEVVAVLKKYLLNDKLDIEYIESSSRDILVCTHGSRDKCCARYGNAFYRQAKRVVNNLSPHHVRVWQASHFGGHRFAPTAIDFPDGRYYARLDADSLMAILTRTGNIELIKPIYRGWGILPELAQVLEREMILIYGWEWFNYKVTAQIIEQSNNEHFARIELSFLKSDGSGGCIVGDVVVDESKECYLISYCDGTEKELVPQFCVKNLLINGDVAFPKHIT